MIHPLKMRHLKERWFKRAGFMSLWLALLFLGCVLGNIIYEGYPAFFRTEIASNVGYSPFLNPYFYPQVPIQ